MNEELWTLSFAHAQRINQLEKENSILATRVERLEAIIISMAQGSESSAPGSGDAHFYNSHTHWVYPANGAGELVDEMMAEREAEADAAQEEYERQMDEEAMRCPRCGDSTSFMLAPDGDLCAECKSELAEERVRLGYASMEIEEGP